MHKKSAILKKTLFIFISFIIVFMAMTFLLNIKVTTRQGIDYKCSTIKMPLYLKILDFFDRHYNYKELVERIIEGTGADEEKAIKIFEWTYKNIRKRPESLLTIDDHVWHIIVRGYGATDQLCDVFATLCNYAGIKALYAGLNNKRGGSRKFFGFARINQKWHVFDVYNGVYFVKKQEPSLASIEDIANGDWKEVGTGAKHKTKLSYKDFFSEVSEVNYDEAHKFSHSNLQSPLNRLVYEIIKKK